MPWEKDIVSFQGGNTPHYWINLLMNSLGWNHSDSNWNKTFFSHQNWCLFLLASLYRFGYLEMRVSLPLLTEGTSKILWGHFLEKETCPSKLTWNWCSSHSIHIWMVQYIYLHIYNKNQPHVAKYTSPMDGLGLFQGCFMFQYSLCRFQRCTWLLWNPTVEFTSPTNHDQRVSPRSLKAFPSGHDLANNSYIIGI